MGDISFKTYAAGLPSASTPPLRTDGILMLQGADVVLLPFADLLSSIPTTVDASSAPVTFDLDPYTDIILIKTDATANAVTVLDTSGKTVMRQANIAIVNQDEAFHFTLIDSNWYRI